jgi:Fe-S cluster assembly scaffold protein SufB
MKGKIMNNLKLNETPVRTSRNFNINNIKLENINIPDNIECFENVTITGENLQIENATSDINLVYGLGDFLTKQVRTQSNQKIKIEIDSKSNKETQVEFKFDDENLALLEDIEIVANENTKSTIIIKYLGNDEIQNYHNGILRVNAKKDSNINIIIVNLMNSNSDNFMAIENALEENSRVNYCIIDFGGKNSVTNYYSNLLGAKSENTINTIYLGKENQLFDLNYIGELRGEKSNIDIEVQGALKGNSKKHFKGTIDFKKGCKKAKGNENEACMLLSDTAKSLALPMLLCSEEDVEGNHSSSAGKIGEKELFYIMSRGFELKEAQTLMVKAKFNKILENIKNEELKEEILNEIDKRLD